MHEMKLIAGLLMNPSIGVEVSAPDGRIIDSNATFQRFAGFSAEELIQKDYEALCHPADLDQEEAARKVLLLGELEYFHFVKRYRTKSGKLAWGDVTISILFGAEGKLLGFLSLVNDITVLQRERLLHQGRAQVLELIYRGKELKEICEAIVDYVESVEEGVFCSILLLDPVKGTLHKAAAQSLPDFYNEAIEGMKIGDGIGSCGTAAYRKERVIVADILTHPYWARARRLVERTDLRSCWSQPIFASDGSVLGTFALYYTSPREPVAYELSLISSIAELAAIAISHGRAQKALRESEEALRQYDRVKDEFISVAAHELRTPLTAIMGFAEMLNDPETRGVFTPEVMEELLSEIYANSERLSLIIDDLLDLSKISNGFSLSLERKEYALRPIIRKVVERLSRNVRNHAIDVRIDPAVPETVNCDKTRIIQVLENLLSNAVKYSPQGGLIRVEVARGDGGIHVSVTDQGIGMNEVQVSRAFDKFYRANPAEAAIGGLGLGLSIVREIVEAHGGTISIDSGVGTGTTARFILPLERGPSA
jgi:PAS domain S-box-containing protein